MISRNFYHAALYVGCLICLTTEASPLASNPLESEFKTVGMKMSESARAEALCASQEKEERSPEQKKIDSQLLYALYERRGEAVAKGTAGLEINVDLDSRGRVLIDIRARVTEKLLSEVKKLGGKIISHSERFNSIITRFPLEKLEALAGLKDVKFIMPKAEATTN